MKKLMWTTVKIYIEKETEMIIQNPNLKAIEIITKNIKYYERATNDNVREYTYICRQRKYQQLELDFGATNN